MSWNIEGLYSQNPIKAMPSLRIFALVVDLALLAIFFPNSVAAVDMAERNNLVSTIQRCAEDVHNAVDTSENSNNDFITTEYILEMFEDLRNMTNTELDLFNGVLNNISKVDFDNITDHLINAVETIDKALPSIGPTAFTVNQISCKRPHNNSNIISEILESKELNRLKKIHRRRGM